MELTQAIIAEHLDMSQPAISGLLQRLGLGLDAGLDEIRRAYIRQLRRAAANHGGGDMADERLKLTAAKRRKAEMELRTRAGELVEADQVRRALVGISSAMRATLERIPDALAPRLAVETDETAIARTLTAEIDQALTDFAAQLRTGKFARESEVDRNGDA